MDGAEGEPEEEQPITEREKALVAMTGISLKELRRRSSRSFVELPSGRQLRNAARGVLVMAVLIGAILIAALLVGAILIAASGLIQTSGMR